MTATTRYLRPSDIPPALWDPGAGILEFPTAVCDSYTALLQEYGLLELAVSRMSNDSPVGGLTKEATDKHFAQAFDGSVARVQLALLDPKNDVTEISNAFISCLAGNSVVLTDAPCGAGAATEAFLGGIANLRESGILPREPLDVHVIGAEISEFARDYAREMIERLKPSLAQQAIFVETDFFRWDATCDVSTTDLVEEMIVAGRDSSARLLVVANFSGFLERNSKRKEAEPQIKELFRHSSGRNSVAVWIEPQLNKAILASGTFGWLVNLILGPLKRFARLVSGADSEHVLRSFAKFRRPVKHDETPIVRLAAMTMDLERKA